MEISIHPSAIVIVHLLTPFNIIQWSIEEYFYSETYDPTTPRCYGRSSPQRVSAPMSKSFYPILRLILLPLLLLLNFLYLIPPPHPFVFCSVVPSYPLVATSPISAPISVSFLQFLLYFPASRPPTTYLSLKVYTSFSMTYSSPSQRLTLMYASLAWDDVFCKIV